MNHTQEGVHSSTSRENPTTPMAAAAPLPTIRDAPRGPADVQRLPSLNELFPDKWQPENAPQQREYFPGARGPRDWPGPTSIAPSPLLSARSRDNYTPAQAPPSLSPSSQQHSPAMSGRSAPLLPPMQQSNDRRDVPGVFGQGQVGTPPSATREMDPRGYPPPAPPAGAHSPYYPPPREYGQAMAPPPHPGYGAGHPGGYAPMSFDGVSDYGDSKSKGRRRGNLPKPVTDILRMWFQDHVAHPYPTEEEKQQLMHQTGLSISQISNWFINARRRSLPRMSGQGQSDADM